MQSLFDHPYPIQIYKIYNMMGWEWFWRVRACVSIKYRGTNGRLIQSDGGFQVSLVNFVDCMKNTLITMSISLVLQQLLLF